MSRFSIENNKQLLPKINEWMTVLKYTLNLKTNSHKKTFYIKIGKNAQIEQAVEIWVQKVKMIFKILEFFNYRKFSIFINVNRSRWRRMIWKIWYKKYKIQNVYILNYRKSFKFIKEYLFKYIFN